MTVLQFRRAPAFEARTQDGITHDQAMEIGRRFYVNLEAAPTVAARTGIPLKTVCAVLDGWCWGGLHVYWTDRAFV